ncbi:hypothetical protein FACS1894160_1590 [Bacteroidia bacterium]|nr:hypothetical protein FACS1894123_07270 [Bacteroidia bacterium]GHV08017.1 hypothetical protein FACS1894160_1590 [Bacteroidia bacterium]
MKTIAFILTVSVSVNFAFAQGLEEDTLSVYLQNAQYQRAIAYIDNQESTKDLLYQKAFCYKSLNDYLKAIDLLEVLSEENPNDVPVKLQLALCYESTLLYPKGIACYDELIKIDSANTYFQVQKADLLYRSGKYQDALDTYFKINQDANPAYREKNIGMCYEKLNQVDSAKIYYYTAWELEPKDPFLALSLVKIHLKKEDFESALNDSERFLSQDSTHLPMKVLNAFTHYSLNNYEKAAPLFEQCRTEGDSSVIVNRGLGISYYFLGNDSLALPYLNQAFLQDTTNMTVLYGLASVHFNLEQYPEAIACYQKLIEHETPNRNTLYTYIKGMGVTYEKSRLFQEAYSQYMAALQYASSLQSMELYNMIANISENQINEQNLAIHYYEKYKDCLQIYKKSLISREIDADVKEIKIMEIENKLTALDGHLDSLKNKIK